MSRRFWLVAISVAFAALVGLSGCSARTLPPVELTAADSGSSQALSPEQELRVSLDANPTTGYTWAIDGALPSQLKQVGEPKYATESDAIGAGGTEVWTFAAQGSGDGTLKLKYWRSFEATVAPADSFVVKVTVK